MRIVLDIPKSKRNYIVEEVTFHKRINILFVHFCMNENIPYFKVLNANM